MKVGDEEILLLHIGLKHGKWSNFFFNIGLDLCLLSIFYNDGLPKKKKKEKKK